MILPVEDTCHPPPRREASPISKKVPDARNWMHTRLVKDSRWDDEGATDRDSAEEEMKVVVVGIPMAARSPALEHCGVGDPLGRITTTSLAAKLLPGVVKLNGRSCDCGKTVGWRTPSWRAT